MSSYLTSIPPVTTAILAFNVFIHITIFVFSLPLGLFSMSAFQVIYEHEIYRMVSAAFVHNGIFHIFMNMSSLLQLGFSLEVQFGSIQFLFLSLWFVLYTGLFYVVLSSATTWILGDASYLHTGGVGYSGVLFAFAIMESYHTTETSRSVFGMFSVPAKFYPFILLILIQVMLPNISFFGHLAGIATGLSTVYGYLDFSLPSQEGYSHLERSSLFSLLTSRSNYVQCNGYIPRISTHSSSSSRSSVWALVCSPIAWVLSAVWNVVATVLFIFGFPLERFESLCSNCYASIVNQWNRLFANSNNNTNNNATINNTNNNSNVNAIATERTQLSSQVSSNSNSNSNVSLPPMVRKTVTGNNVYVNPNRIKQQQQQQSSQSQSKSLANNSDNNNNSNNINSSSNNNNTASINNINGNGKVDAENSSNSVVGDIEMNGSSVTRTSHGVYHSIPLDE